jgi:hypothetical protein
MSRTDDTKPAAKTGRRNRKGETRRQKVSSPEAATPVEMQTPELGHEQLPQAAPEPAISEPLEDVVAEATAAEDEAVSVDAPSSVEAPEPAEPASAEPSSAEPSPVSLQTIVNAYRDYTRKSFEQFGSFFEQLSGVRSFDKAMEVQTEFVKRAYENSVAESQKIRELHRKLAWQTLEPFESLVGRTPETLGKS